MKILEAPEVVGLLIEYGRRAQLAGGNPYRARASSALPKVLPQTEPLDRLVAKKRRRGIGEAIAAVIEQLHRTGSHPSLEKMRGEIPAGLLELLAIPVCAQIRPSSSTASLASPPLPNSNAQSPTGRHEA